MTTHYQYSWWNFYVSRHLSVQGAQAQLVQDLEVREHKRQDIFKQELKERETIDILDRATLRAYHSKINGVISAPEYHKIVAKVDSLKKLRFTEDYERIQDPATYEWMKYKVAAEVGGAQEIAAFELYEKVKIQEKGEEKYRLFAQSAKEDPVLRFLN